jgi:hypothetical protein
MLVRRADVTGIAGIAVRLLEKEGARSWIDLLDGDGKAEETVERIVNDKIDCMDGEDIGVMKGN